MIQLKGMFNLVYYGNTMHETSLCAINDGKVFFKSNKLINCDINYSIYYIIDFNEHIGFKYVSTLWGFSESFTMSYAFCNGYHYSGRESESFFIALWNKNVTLQEHRIIL